MLLEYEEIITRHMGAAVADDVLDALARFPNVHRVYRYFRWGLIQADPDDNKFVDCAIAGHADSLVTYDRHFDVLKQRNVPMFDVITPDIFQDRLGL